MRKDKLTQTLVNMDPVKERVYAPGTVDKATKEPYTSEELASNEVKAADLESDNIEGLASEIADDADSESIKGKVDPDTGILEPMNPELETEDEGEHSDEPDETEDPQIDKKDLDVIIANIAKRKRKRIIRDNLPSPVMVVLLVIAIIGLAIAILSSSLFTIRGIEVQGNSYFSADEIINIGHAQKGRNLIFKAHAGEIEEYLEKSPYIIDAKVGRKLPGTLVIKVEEREQVAAVVYGSKYLVIDKDGLLLRKTDTEPKITILTGIKVSKVKLGETLEVKDEKLFKSALNLLACMKEGDMYFTAIEMNELYIHAHIYDSLVCVGTDEEITEAIEKDRLQKVLDTLFSKNIKRGTIKLSSDGYASFSPEVQK